MAIDTMMYGTDYQRLWDNKCDWSWAAADGAGSRVAPNGFTYWFWGDTILGYPGAGTNFDANRIMVSNSLMVQRGAELGPATYANGTPAVPDATMNAVLRRFWTTDIIFPIETPEKAYVLCQRIHDSGGTFITDGTMIAEFDILTLGMLRFVQMHETPTTLDELETTEIQWAQSWEELGGYIYIYGYRQDGAGVGYLTPHRSFVARVPSKRLLDKHSWQIWQGTGWQAGRNDQGLENANEAAAVILDGQLTSVRYDTNNGRWLFAHKPWNGLGTAVEILSATAPQGPLTLKQSITSTGGTSPGGNAFFTYNATLHPQVDLFNASKTLVAISHNGDFADIFTERTLYHPEFQEVTIPL